jgi:hypothetical protein
MRFPSLRIQLQLHTQTSQYSSFYVKICSITCMHYLFSSNFFFFLSASLITLYFFIFTLQSLWGSKKKKLTENERKWNFFILVKTSQRFFFLLRYYMHVMLCSESFVLLPFVNCICSFNNNNNSYIYPIDVCAHNCYDADENIVFWSIIWNAIKYL